MAKTIDLTGKSFYLWKVISLEKNRDLWGENRWLCECKCGVKMPIKSSDLRKGRSKGCYECRKQFYNRKPSWNKINIDLYINQRFGSLIILKEAESNKTQKKYRRVTCKCDCGKEKDIMIKKILKGLTTSCGHAQEKGKNSSGKPKYIRIYKPNHQNSNCLGYIDEHVLVMSEHVGRPLKKGEQVHHKNSIKSDNRLENLELWSTNHPSGYRPKDMFEFCLKYIEEYKEEYYSGKLN